MPGTPEPSLDDLIDAFFEQWIETRKKESVAIAARDFSSISDNVIFSGIHEGGNSINRAGHKHLLAAAEKLLRKEKLDGRLRTRTAYNALVQAFFKKLPKIRSSSTFSAKAILDAASIAVHATPRDDGIYVFPIVFAPKANSDFAVGPIRIVSKDIFLREQSDAFSKERGIDDFHAQLGNEWSEYVTGYDHFVTVRMLGLESDVAWPLARDAAEFGLNLIRMSFGLYHTDDIRIGNGFRWEVKQATVRIALDGSPFFSSSSGPWGTHFGDEWMEHFETMLGGHAGTLASYAQWLVDAIEVRNPVYERMKYANQLIAEGYSEPHAHIRLVRVVSALEALALLSGKDKAHNLALNCAYVGSYGDPERACEIYDAIRAAYSLRSEVVHGDAPSATRVSAAFRLLDDHLVHIYLGFALLFAAILRTSKVQSIAELRRQFNRRIEFFYWNPDLMP